MNNLPVQPRPLKLQPGELGLTSQALFAGAGITDAEQFNLLRTAFNTILSHLNAKSRKVFQYQGSLTYSRLLPDLPIRAKATDQVLTMLGITNQDSPKVTIQVTVNQPPWMLTPTIPPPKDITPANNSPDQTSAVALEGGGGLHNSAEEGVGGKMRLCTHA